MRGRSGRHHGYCQQQGKGSSVSSCQSRALSVSGFVQTLMKIGILDTHVIRHNMDGELPERAESHSVDQPPGDLVSTVGGRSANVHHFWGDLTQETSHLPIDGPEVLVSMHEIL